MYAQEVPHAHIILNIMNIDCVWSQGGKSLSIIGQLDWRMVLKVMSAGLCKPSSLPIKSDFKTRLEMDIYGYFDDIKYFEMASQTI